LSAWAHFTQGALKQAIVDSSTAIRLEQRYNPQGFSSAAEHLVEVARVLDRTYQPLRVVAARAWHRSAAIVKGSRSGAPRTAKENPGIENAGAITLLVNPWWSVAVAAPLTPFFTPAMLAPFFAPFLMRHVIKDPQMVVCHQAEWGFCGYQQLHTSATRIAFRPLFLCPRLQPRKHA
jgi:hypothetical protein